MSFNSYILIIAFLMFSWTLTVVPKASAQSKGEKIITSIEVRGNKRVEKETILFYIKAKKGDVYTPFRIKNDIQAIYRSGHFEDIRVETEVYKKGIKLIYIVKEIPFIREILFVGNKKISKKDIEEKLELKKGSFYDKNKVKKAEKTIQSLYEEKGFFFATVKSIIVKTTENQTDLVFKISEKKKVGIKKISFVGNKAFSDKVLRKVINTKKKGLFSFLTRTGIYQKEMISTDLLRIESFYRQNGYINVKTQEPKIDINKMKKAIFIKIPIEEGERYKTGKIEFVGDDTFSKKKLGEMVKLKEGDIYDLSKVREGVFNITEIYSEQGYAYAEMTPDIQVNSEEKKVDIVMEIDKGKKIYIGKINIEGNIKTKDKVIRREFRFNEGELFDSIKLKRSKERIVNTMFFEDVQIQTSRGDLEDTIDITTSLVERPTGSIGVGIGYSSIDNAIFTGQITQDNFLGNGQKIQFSANISSRRTDFDLSFTEPRLFNREISVGVDVFNLESDFLSFNSKRTGGGFRVGKAFTEFIWGNIGYQYETITISDVLPGAQTAFLKNETRVTSQIIPAVVRDTVDNALNPTKGKREIISGQIAGGILGGVSFYKFAAEGSYFHPLFAGLVGMLHGKIAFGQGYQGDVLPINERFFMGGPSDLRGFTFEDVGPKDINGDPLGGEKLLLFNLEIQYPFSNNIRGIIFYDRGNVYGDGTDLSLTKSNFDLLEMRHSVGAAVKFLSPLGPIGFAYGYKLDKAAGESPAEFHFLFGRSF